MAYPHVDKLTPFEDNVTEVLAEDQIHHALYGTLQVSSLPIPITGSATAGSADQTLVCSGATFISSGVVVGTPIYNGSDQSVAVVKSITSETTLVTTPLKWGTTNSWISGYTFSVGAVPKMLVTLTQADSVNPPGSYIRNSSNDGWVFLSDKLQVVHITSSVTAAPNTSYLVDASAGNVVVTLPNATTGDKSEYRVVLSENSHSLTVTTAGGTQLIGGKTSQKIATVGGWIYIKSGDDHYDIISDTRLLYRSVDVTANLDLSTSGYESSTVYHIEPSGGTITITIPDASEINNGTSAIFTIHGEGTAIVKTLSGELIEGESEQDMTAGSFELICLGDHYIITQDSRPKVQNSSIMFYSLNELTAISDGAGGFYRQSSITTTDARYSSTSTTITTGTIGTDTFLFASISDAGSITGLLPEWPVTSTVNIARNTGSASFRFYVKYYHRTAGGVETLLGTSSLSNVIDTTTIQGFNVSATINEATFSSTDSMVRKVYGVSSGSPTAKVSIEGTQPSFSTFSAPSSIVPHNSLAGVQQAASGVTNGHISDAAQTIAGDKTFSGNTTLSSVKITGGTPGAGKVLTSDASGNGTWTTPSGGWSGKTQFDIFPSGTVVRGLIGGFVAAYAGTLNMLVTRVTSLPVGSSILVDLRVNGTTVLSTTLAITTTESLTGTKYVVKTGDSGKATISTASFSAGNEITVHVTQEGSTFAWVDLWAEVVYTYS